MKHLEMNLASGKKDEKEQQVLLPNGMYGYLSEYCRMPLPKYQDGGIFSSYFESANYFTELDKPGLASQKKHVESKKEKVEEEKEEKDLNLDSMF